MEYTSDSDLSDDTRDSVSRGFASVKRKRRMATTQSDGVRERFTDSNMDTSNVRHPSGRGVSIGDTSTHGLAAAGVETAISQNYNIIYSNLSLAFTFWMVLLLFISIVRYLFIYFQK